MRKVSFDGEFYTINLPEGVGMFPKSMFRAVQAYEDAKMGRWRDPDNPEYVVYPKDNHQPSNGGRLVLVMKECVPKLYERMEGREPLSKYVDSKIQEVSENYFKAHPVKKPWHDAQLGEFWKLDLGSQGVHVAKVAVPYLFSIVSEPGPYFKQWAFDNNDIVDATKLEW